MKCFIVLKLDCGDTYIEGVFLSEEQAQSYIDSQHTKYVYVLEEHIIQ